MGAVIKSILCLVALSLSVGSVFAQEKTFPVQGRLFMSATRVNPVELNQYLNNEGLKSLDNFGQLGVEITYPLAKYLDVGMRYGRRGMTTLEPGQLPNTSNYGELSQDALLLLARVPLLRSALLRFDVFGGVGGTNTTFDIKSASQNGQLSKKATADWFASPYMSAGVSAGLGYKKFYIYLESGYDHNRVSGLSRSGTVNESVNALQLSGPYLMIGLMFDGVSGTKR